MGLSGKLIGAGIGFFLGGPLGAVVGGLLGHYVKDAPLQSPGERPVWEGDPAVRQQREEFYFVANLVGILSAMLQADGEVRREEVQAIRTFFSERLGYRGESLDIVRDLIKQFLKAGVDLEGLCRDLSSRSDYSTRLLLVECLRDVATADGRMNAAEAALIDRVVRLLGIAQADLDRILGTTGNGVGRKDYAILGISPEAGAEEVKRAYRDLAKRYHPDMVAHLGEEFQALARNKFLDIQEAYRRIRTAQGF